MAESVVKRLVRAMNAMDNPVKNTQGYGYKYATLDQVLGIVKQALADEGLGVRQRVFENDGSCTLKTFLLDCESTSLDMFVLDSRPVYIGEDAQKNGSFETYSRRYALLTSFGLAPEDDDGRSTVSNEREQVIDAVEAAKGRLWRDAQLIASEQHIDAKGEYRRLMTQACNFQQCNVDELTAETIIAVCEKVEKEYINEC